MHGKAARVAESEAGAERMKVKSERCQECGGVMKSGMDNFGRKFVSIVVCLLFVIVADTRAESRAVMGSTEGIFVGIEQGDYAHFQIKDTKGKDDSFIVLRPDKSVQAYLDNPTKFKGRKVRVHWKEQVIPEAGGPMKTVTKVESEATNSADGAEMKPEARSFPAFWAQFKAAVAKGDKTAIAEMTKIPFPYGTKHLSKAEFIQECGKLFDQKTRKCFAKAKPVKEDDRESYSVFCGEDIFVFSKENGEFLFSDIGMND